MSEMNNITSETDKRKKNKTNIFESIKYINMKKITNKFKLILMSILFLGIQNFSQAQTTASALHFDGGSNRVQGSDANLPTGNSARTMEAWVKIQGVTTHGYILEYGSPDAYTQAQACALTVHHEGKFGYWGHNRDFWSTSTTVLITIGII